MAKHRRASAATGTMNRAADLETDVDGPPATGGIQMAYGLFQSGMNTFSPPVAVTFE